MPESSTSTWEHDPIALLGLGVFDSTVDSDSLGEVGYRLGSGGWE